MSRSLKLSRRRGSRVRFRLKMSNKENRPRLSVFRSGRHVYAQLVDDRRSHTLVSASSLEPNSKSVLGTGSHCRAAAFVGRLLAQRAADLGIKEVVFDRGPYLFHGRVRALADAAREAGLLF